MNVVSRPRGPHRVLAVLLIFAMTSGSWARPVRRGEGEPFPYPVFVDLKNPGNRITSGSLSSATWRELYCKEGFNQHCLDHLVFSSALRQKTQQDGDLGIKLAIAAANDYARTVVHSGRNGLNALEVESLQLQLNHIVKTYREQKQVALGEGKAWKDSDSVKSFMNIMSSLPPEINLALKLNVELLSAFDATLKPFRQLEAQNNLEGVRQSAASLGDVYGDSYLLAKTAGGYSNAVDPFLGVFAGINTQDNAESILSGDAVLDGLLVSKENRNLLRGIQERIEKDGTLNQEELGKIFSQLKDQGAILGELLKQKKDEEEREKNLAKLKDYEAGLQIFSTLTSMISDPAVQRFGQQATVVGKAALTIYASVLNPEKLSKWVLTGNILGAVASVFSLFGGGADPNQVILEEIANLRNDLRDLHKTVVGGFEATHKKLDLIFRQMMEGFDQILQKQRVAENLILTLLQEVRNIDRRLGHFEMTVSAQFDSLATRIQKLQELRCFEYERLVKSDAFSEADFVDCALAIRLAGTDFAEDFSATHLSDLDLKRLNFQPDSIYEAGASRDFRLDRVHDALIGIASESEVNFLAALGLLNTGVSVFPRSEKGLKKVIPSIIGWTAAAARMDELMNLYPQHRGQMKPATFSDLATKGEEIQNAVKLLRDAAFQNGLLAAISAEQKALVGSVGQLQTAVLKHHGLFSHDAGIWQGLPSSGVAKVTLPTSIPAGSLGTSKDLVVDYSNAPIPNEVLLAIQLGVGTLGIATANLVKGHGWAQMKRIVTRTDTIGTPRPGMPFTSIEHEHVDTHLAIRSKFLVGDMPFLTAFHKTHAYLFIGESTALYTTGRVKNVWAKRLEQRDDSKLRGWVDVLEQVWDDHNYDLKRRISYVPASGKSLSRIVEASRKIWNARQVELRDVIVDALQGRTLPDFREPMEAVAFHVRRLEALYGLTRAVMAIAFEGVLATSDELIRTLYFEDGTTSGTGVAKYVNDLSLPLSTGSVVGLLTSYLEEKQKALSAGITKAVNTPQNQTLVAVDVLVARMRARAEVASVR